MRGKATGKSIERRKACKARPGGGGRFKHCDGNADVFKRRWEAANARLEDTISPLRIRLIAALFPSMMISLPWELVFGDPSLFI
jgi:hypothetical protein